MQYGPVSALKCSALVSSTDEFEILGVFSLFCWLHRSCVLLSKQNVKQCWRASLSA